MTAPATIRAARVADADAIAGVNVAAWAVAYRGLVPDELLGDKHLAERQARWRARLSDPKDTTLTLVAEIDDQVGGFCRCGPTRDPDDDPATTGELYAMYVHPDRWRNRIGAALMRAAVDHLATDRYAAATLWVLADNAAGIAFYTAQGWRRDGGAKLAEMGSARPLEIRLRRALGANP